MKLGIDLPQIPVVLCLRYTEKETCSCTRRNVVLMNSAPKQILFFICFCFFDIIRAKLRDVYS